MKSITVEPIFTEHSSGKIEFHCSDEDREKIIKRIGERLFANGKVYDFGRNKPNINR